jgi:hypothetical protein
VSAVLRRARAGYLAYFPGYLGKSSIFACVLCPRLVPLFPERNPSERDGVIQGEHYLTTNDLMDDSSLEAIGCRRHRGASLVRRAHACAEHPLSWRKR